MKKIESCPHCGGVSKVRKEDNAYFVRCEDCGATSGRIYRNEKSAVEAWNRRAENVVQDC